MEGIQKIYEIVFVDDGSADHSFNVLVALKKADKHLKIVKLRRNSGQTSALDAGFRHSSGHIVISMDADLQNDPEDIPVLIQKLDEGYDVVCGWRHRRRDSFSKRMISRGACLLRKWILKDSIHDSGCTLRAYKRRTLDHLEIYGEMHRFIPALLSAEGFKVTEIKVKHHFRGYGSSKYKSDRILKGMLDMLIVRFWMQYSARPIHLFGGVGLLMSLIGFAFGLYLSIIKLCYAQSIGNRPLLLLAVLLMLMGMQFMMFGVLADVMAKIYYGGRKKTYFIDEII